jgi:hypothetical protein
MIARKDFTQTMSVKGPTEHLGSKPTPVSGSGEFPGRCRHPSLGLNLTHEHHLVD